LPAAIIIPNPIGHHTTKSQNHEERIGSMLSKKEEAEPQRAQRNAEENEKANVLRVLGDLCG
jgi:hypothetical protein